MTRLILHIGHPKTGTTTLQDTFAASRKSMMRHGVLYPRAPKVNKHLLMKGHFFGADYFSQRVKTMFKGTDDQLREKARLAWEMIVQDIKTHKPDTIVLSSESFFSAPRNPKFETLMDTICSLADEITVVAYLRDPASFFL